jgi:glycosyltransferase involved in cell wall biosynthesis
MWEGKTRRPLGLGGHFERILRRFVIPGCTGIVWAADAAKCCLELAHKRPGQKVVLLTTYPPVGVALAGLLAVIQAPVRWVADFRDPVCIGSEVVDWPRLAKWTLTLLESVTYRHAAAVIANTEHVADVWRERFPWARKRIHVIWNGFDPEDRLQALPLAVSPVRTIIHAGDLYHGRNPNLIVEAFARLRALGKPETSNVRIVLVGPVGNFTGIDWDLHDAATRDGWLEFRKPVPRREAQHLVAQAGGLLLLQPGSRNRVPAKLFDYIFIGRPILALVPPDSSVEYVLAHAGVPYRCVYTCDPPAEIDRKLLEFLRLPTDPVPFSSWFETHFDSRRQTGQLAALLESI